MKTPVEVVESALGEWGNGEAQDAFAEVVKRLRDAEQERDEDQGVIRVWRGRCERAEADNAALLAEMKEAHDNYESISGDVFSRPHPGAALLEELEGLRKRDALLTSEAVKGGPLGLELMSLRKQVAEARDAALEEAARVADVAFEGAWGDEDAWAALRELREDIRALKGTK